LLLERRVDLWGVTGQVADRPLDLPASQALQPAVAEGGDVTLGGGPSDAGDFGGLLAGEAVVEEPERQHLAANVFVGVGVALGVDDPLLLLGPLNAIPAHRPALARSPASLAGPPPCSMPTPPLRKRLIKGREEYSPDPCFLQGDLGRADRFVEEDPRSVDSLIPGDS
jgi:hypothetical protein